MVDQRQSIFNKRKSLFDLITGIKGYFAQQGFTETPVPLAVPHPGLEAHLHPFRLQSARDGSASDLYLNTSPEFAMKELLSLGFEKIYSLNWSYRDEPNGAHHRPQFLMLEWYRSGEHYTKLMSETAQIINLSYEHLAQLGAPVKKNLDLNIQIASVDELFREYAQFSILDFIDSKEELYQKLKSDFSELPIPKLNEVSWDDLFFITFLNVIEPELAKIDFLLVKEYPAPLAALSTIKQDDPRVCERFEVYAQGVELCNCFNELTNLEEQVARFNSETKLKEQLYQYKLPQANVLFNALERGLPTSCGNALGVERLLAALTDFEDGFYS